MTALVVDAEGRLTYVGEDGRRRVILIDALDECEDRGKNDLLDLIAQRFRDLPTWLRLVVTSRPEGPIVKKLAAFKPLPMECDKNTQDARDYLAHLLQGKAEEPAKALELMVERSQSLFLYLGFVRQRLAVVDKDEPATLEDLKHFPDGLDGIYENDFQRAFPDDGAWREAKPLLEAIVAALEPLPVEVAAAALRLSDREQRKQSDAISLLFPVRDGAFQAIHKSVVDWLTDAERSGGDQ